MKIKIVVTTFVFFSFAGCKKCKDYVHIDYPVYMHKIFDVYRPGCYFLYVNQDSTKYDSIYISDYTSGVAKDHLKTCLSANFREFKLHSKYLANADIYCNYYTHIENGGYSEFMAFSSTVNFQKDREFTFNGRGSEKYMYFNYQTLLKKIDYYTLWDNPSLILEDVSVLEGRGFKGDIYFSAYVGIAKYITNDFKDTFKVYKNYVP